MDLENENFYKYKPYFLIIFLLLFQGCQGQVTKDEKDIEAMQQSAAVASKEIKLSSPVDFKHAAKIATPGVVNIKSTYKPGNNRYQENYDNRIPDQLKDFFKDDFFFRFFDFQVPQSEPYNPQPIIGGGSGVILTNDGYIVTNNHVVKEADEVNVTLFDGRSYPAKIIGNDPLTDLALLKISEKNLSFIQFGDSDTIEVGEWVVAVGNPFNLASTVTAGIVSAKARNINILKDQGAIESFIQTDAAVNPGNSGGALVSLQGKLIGINTAIATPTGVYAGYAFAIPVDIVKKVVNDLMNFGTVQRGVLGINIRDLNSTLAKEIKINRANGVFVDSVMTSSAAEKAGIKSRDVIISVDDIETISSSKLQEIISRKRPGEKVKIAVIRNGKDKKELTAILKKMEEKAPTIINHSNEILEELGVELEEITAADKRKYKLTNGLKVTKLSNGKLKQNTSMKIGFIITAVNKIAVHNIQSFVEAVEKQRGGIMIEGKYPDSPITYYYAFGR